MLIIQLFFCRNEKDETQSFDIFSDTKTIMPQCEKWLLASTVAIFIIICIVSIHFAVT